MKPTTVRTTLAGYVLAMHAAVLMIALSPLGARAAGTATIETGGQSNTMVWLNLNTIRFDIPSADDSYIVARDGKIYMVNTAAGGDMPHVMEIGGMMQGLAQMGSSPQSDKTSPLAMRITSIKATGKEETVAGIEGEVYELTTTDNKGKSRATQAVFTDDPLVVEMTAAYLAFTEALMGAEAMTEFKTALPKGKSGLLRAGNDMVVQSIDADRPAANMFELPAEPVNISDMIKQLSQQPR